MQRFQRLLVPLSATATDHLLIRWAKEVALLSKATQVRFVHVLDQLDLSKELEQRFPELKPSAQQVGTTLEATIREHWHGESLPEPIITVVEGSSEVLAVLQVALNDQSDLLIVNRDSRDVDFAIRLARKAPCSVMTITENSEPVISRITVPTDYSSYAFAALDVGMAFARAKGLPSLDSLNVFTIGNYAHRVAMDAKDLVELQLGFAQDRHRQFLDKINSHGLKLNAIEAYHPYVPAGIMRETKALGSDLIVTGCRGKGTVTALLLGSNAEELLKNAMVPVIAAKVKGTGQHLLKALLHGADA
jgi:nucleotide-binding universal stress UspA family protein